MSLEVTKGKNMHTMTWKKTLLLAAAASLTALASGCIVEEHPASPTQVVYVRQQPPADLAEEIPPHPPGPYWVWQKGHWRWNGHQYYWSHGHWAERPPQYSAWVAPHWDVRSNGYFFIEGHWE